MKQSSGKKGEYITLEFLFYPSVAWHVRESNLADRQARFSRISIRISLHLCQLRSLQFIAQPTPFLRISLSRYPQSCRSSLPESMMELAVVPSSLSTIRDSDIVHTYFSAMFAIAKQSEPGSTSVRHFGANSSPDDAFECRLFVVPCSFNESGISSILSPTTWRTIRNRIWTRYRILMATPITDSKPYVGESFDCTKVVAAIISPSRHLAL